ncbi:MAG: response regulator transcription factor [Chloroflexi bacterium]|nr:response regulator transcription factor [Chloroflexota bacterium]
MASPAVLVVEDEETLARAITYSLEREGYSALAAKDGAEGLAMAKQHAPDLVILDLMLPKIDGLEVCRILRRETTLPILMLTAKAEEVDKIVGLELGADDYMTKPFSMRELMARVKALLRRVELDRRAAKAAPAGEVLRSDGLTLDPAARRVKLRERPIALRPKEFDLLAFLMRNKAIVFTRDALLEQVWGYEYGGDSRTVDVHIRWLREKIEEAPGEPKHLLTVRGVGYKFEG